MITIFQFNRQQIQWTQLVNLVEDDLIGQNQQAGGLRMLPKLSNEHIRLTPSLRMKVKLATQVYTLFILDFLIYCLMTGHVHIIFDDLSFSRCNLKG